MYSKLFMMIDLRRNSQIVTVAKVGKERVKKCHYKNQFGVKYFRF